MSEMKFFWFPSLNQRWMISYGFWILLLSGALSNFVGSPGAIQAFHLQALRDQKKIQLAQITEEVKKLKHESSRLQHSSLAQEKEIRKVLGYSKDDEIIFDFVPADSQ